ncbi:polysaccharide pyruvyl transferase family protein [Rhodococcoides yunnanense]|uniref:polysaccharide pyruvyl transferase family protein n=1 Tax=Rhodococcoides yunnanense TaxID=278209 RepID=UPI0022B16254|nr:polysaccharide pyruvyl transferase family protein [Rhodococcus yunnanensis]MCZ4278358.1 polysaccharide pyruvyl transferase family protein [Rhodococcus yunnanensis]
MTQIMRSALAGWSMEGVTVGVRLILRTVPHAASAVVAASGLVAALKSSVPVAPKSAVRALRDVLIGVQLSVEFGCYELIRWYVRVAPRNRRTAVDRNLLLCPPGGGNIGDQAMVESFIANSTRGVSLIVRSRNDFAIDPRWIDSECEVVEMPDLLYGSGFRQLRAAWRFIRELHGYSTFSVIGADIMDGAYNVRASARRAYLAGLAASIVGDARVIGFSWNGTSNVVARTALKYASRRGAVLCIRDSVSYDRARRDGLSSLRLVSDSAFALPEQRTRSATSPYCDLVKKIEERPYVIVNASGLVARNRDQVSDYSALVEMLEGLGYLVVLVPHVIRSSGDDLAACRAIFDDSTGSAPVLVETVFSPFEIRSLCARAVFVVTGRMHLGVLALSAAVPPVVVATQGKVEGLMAMFGIESLMLTPDSDFGRQLLESVREVLRNRPDYVSAVSGVLPSVVGQARLNFDGL